MTGTLVSQLRYLPYGATRWSSGAMPTDRRYTGQREEASLGLYDYGARFYSPSLGRFISADSIVPGAANGAGGAAATLGYDAQTRLTPLTVNLGEFVLQVNAENREILQLGPFFQWDARTRQEHHVPMGPANPQSLNRYAYCLGNPLRYIDPTGHDESPTQTIAKLLCIAATVLDMTSLGLSASGVLLEMVGLALGIAEPSPGGGEAIGIGGAIKLYQPLNAMENRLAVASWLLNGAADILNGATYFQKVEVGQTGVTATELVLGQDTIVSWGIATVGYSPEPTSDFIINFTAVVYDFGRLSGKIPTFCHGVMGIDQSLIPYLGVVQEN